MKPYIVEKQNTILFNFDNLARKKWRMQTLFSIAIILMFGLIFTQANAQQLILPLKTVHYTAKFVCGAQTGPSILIGQNVGYSSFQPGNYTTSLNIFRMQGLQPDVEVYASVDGMTNKPQVLQFSSQQIFDTHTLGCNDIIAALGLSATNQVIEGFLYITRKNPDLNVQAVYTYASLGSLEFGVGASIDVERILPVEISNLRSLP